MIFKLAALGATSFVIAFSGAIMPGPLLTITIGESVKRGARAGPLIIVGHAILEGLHRQPTPLSDRHVADVGHLAFLREHDLA